MSDYQPERLERADADLYVSTHPLPDPATGKFRNGGVTADHIFHFANDFTIAVAKRLSEGKVLSDQLIIDILATSAVSDDPMYTAYNSLILAEYFEVNGISSPLSITNFTSAVSGLSHHNGEKGSTSMQYLCEPDKIAGAAAVVRFIGSMDKNGMVKASLLKHTESSGRYELTVTNPYLDRLLRHNPESFEAICNYLESRPVTKTKKSIQPLVEHLETNGSSVLVNGAL